MPDFNPHEREARDAGGGGSGQGTFYFNPHEREARDQIPASQTFRCGAILIHTSVKLVTGVRHPHNTLFRHFNPHEREARDTPLKHFAPHLSQF